MCTLTTCERGYASFDGCDEVLREHFPDVFFIQSDTNLGFARANNLAVQRSRGASLLFLNPDTKIVGAAILRLQGALQQLPGAGIVGAKLLNGDGSLQTTCVQSFPTIINQVLDFEWLRRRWRNSDLWGMAALYCGSCKAEEVEVISGACLMMRRELFERIGGFSEEYFMYSEDLDLCHKVKRAGWRNYYVPDALVVHFGGGGSKQTASNFSSVMMRESICRFLRKTRGSVYAFGYRCSIVFSACCRVAFLAALFPAQGLRGRQQSWSVAWSKWWAILAWSLWREHRTIGAKRPEQHSGYNLVAHGVKPGR